MRTVVGAVMHKKIPGVCDERPGNESAAGDQIDQRATNPDLPKDFEDSLVGVGMVQNSMRVRPK